jgi:hypothetical protein
MVASTRSGRSGRRLSSSRWLRVIVLSSLVLTAIFATGQSSALAANSGTVTCIDQEQVVGVWVNVSGGASNFATRSGSGYSQHWSYNTQGRPYSLTVGCGGSTASWRYSTSTPYYSTGWSSVSCFPGGSYGYGTAYVYNRCYNG